jgi:DNA-binding GntR family transcriptional regulator
MTDQLRFQENKSGLLSLSDLGANPATIEVSRGSTIHEPRSEVERVYGLLHEWVVSAELPPGAFLSEPELAERCNTSRTPVREALGRLAQDGWVTSIHRKGFRVRPITLKDLSEMYTYRRVFEQFTAEQAAVAGSTEQFDGLARILEMERRSEKQPAEMVTANELFHLTLAEMTGNERIVMQMRLVMAHVRRLETISPLHLAEQIRHEEILEAIIARDARLAHSLMGEHVSYALSVMIRSFC